MELFTYIISLSLLLFLISSNAIIVDMFYDIFERLVLSFRYLWFFWLNMCNHVNIRFS